MQAPPSRLAPPFAIVLAFEAGLGLAAIALAWAVGMPLAMGEREPIVAAALGLAAALPMIGCLVVVDCLSLAWLDPLKRLVRRWVLPLFREYQWWQLLLVSLAAGWGEELLFRGVLQPWVARFTDSRVAGVMIVALLFGAVHALSRSYLIAATGMGIYFGWLAIACQSLIAPIVTHAIYDFAALVYLLATDRRAGSDNAANATQFDNSQSSLK